MKIRALYEQEFTLEDGTRVYYTDYNEYLKTQIKRASISREATVVTTHRRQAVYDLMKDLEIKTILCVGCRDVSELTFFREKGYIVEGIDLLKNQPYITCDMSHMGETLKDKKYDAVISIESLEHCLDLKGFISGLNQVCSKYFICYTPILDRPSNWDVAVHPFASLENTEEKVKNTFSQFKINYINVHYEAKDKYNRLVFILEKC